MPQVQFSYPAKKIQATRGMPTPKRMSELRYWYKDARKAIPAIPEINGPSDRDGRMWREQSVPEVSDSFIRWTLENDKGERAYVVIARKAPSIGV